MKVYFVRHGEKNWGGYYNPSLKHQDEPLSETGEHQAMALCSRFEGIAIDRMLISQYRRTAETAKYIACAKGLIPEIDKRLNEIDNGVIELLATDEIMRRYPDFWRDFKSHDKDVRFPGGETGAEVKARQDELIEDLKDANKDALLVTHEGYMRLLLCNLLGLPVYKRHMFRIGFCGMMELEYNRETDEWIIVRVNQEI